MFLSTIKSRATPGTTYLVFNKTSYTTMQTNNKQYLFAITRKYFRICACRVRNVQNYKSWHPSVQRSTYMWCDLVALNQFKCKDNCWRQTPADICQCHFVALPAPWIFEPRGVRWRTRSRSKLSLSFQSFCWHGRPTLENLHPFSWTESVWSSGRKSHRLDQKLGEVVDWKNLQWSPELTKASVRHPGAEESRPRPHQAA